MKVKAPDGYYWMEQKNGAMKLIKYKDTFIPHKGASLEVDFPLQKKYNKTNG